MNRKDIDFSTNLGEQPASRSFTDMERKLLAFVMGINAALIQFTAEGIIPHEQQPHFMMHLQDFVARLYANEKLDLKELFGDTAISVRGETTESNQTMAVDSRLGEVYLAAAEEALANGRVEHVRPADLEEMFKQSEDMDGKANVPNASNKRILN